MTSDKPRKRGAQPGNLNALKTGRYSGLYFRSLSAAGQVRLSQAMDIDPTDLAHEIGVLRERLDKAVHAKPEAFELFCLMVRTITRAVATQYAMKGSSAQRLYAATETVLDDMRQQLLLKGAD